MIILEQGRYKALALRYEELRASVRAVARSGADGAQLSRLFQMLDTPATVTGKRDREDDEEAAEGQCLTSSPPFRSVVLCSATSPWYTLENETD